MAEEKPEPGGLFYGPKPTSYRSAEEIRESSETKKKPLTFAQIHSKLIDSDLELSDEERQKLARERNEIVSEVLDYNNGRYVRGLRRRVIYEVENSNWDQVYGRLLELGNNLENSLQGEAGYDPRWQGVVETSIGSFAARVVRDGIRAKLEDQEMDEGEFLEWAREKHFSKQEFEDLMQEEVKGRDLRRQLGFPEHPGEMVGDELPKPTEPQDFTRMQEELLERISDERTTAQERERLLADLLRQTQDAQLRMVEAFGRQPTWEERSRWVRVMHDQTFYARFNPGQEPRFFTDIWDDEERGVWDDMFSLSRSAYIKRATASMPEKYKENSELEQLLGKNLERLYEKPGVRPMLEAYSRSIVNKEKIELSPETYQKRLRRWKEKYPTVKFTQEIAEELKKMTIWDCESLEDFEDYRENLRTQVLLDQLFSNPKDLDSLPTFDQAVEEARVLQRDSKIEADHLLALEADTVAWNLLFIFDQVESSNSYYSHAGKRYYTLPGIMFSADHGGALHQNERWFWKVYLAQNWGAFSKWGIEQIKKVKGEIDRSYARRIKDLESDYEKRIRAAEDSDERERLRQQKEDELEETKREEGKKASIEHRYVPAAPDDYWKWQVVEGELPDDVVKASQEGKVVEIRAPECYPVTTCGSFFEEFEARTADGISKTLLQFLVDGEKLPWEQVLEDASAIWLWSKFNKAVQLQDKFNFEAEKRYQLQNPATARGWVDTFLEICEARLGINKLYDIPRKAREIIKRNRGRTIEGAFDEAVEEMADKEIREVEGERGRALTPAQEAEVRRAVRFKTKIKKPTYQDYSRLKTWGVYADSGGVVKVTSKKPSINLTPRQQAPLLLFLKGRTVGFFGPGEGLKIS